ncbi:protein-L-isoaspartate O-methyltransferase [soil metagenome]
MSTAIDKAFEATPRKEFIPPEVRGEAGVDWAVPIGYGQTNSQPYTVRMMLEWLDVQPGQKVLDVGSGSGWTTALLSYLVGPDGRVAAVEKVPELVEFGRDNCRRLGVKNADFFQAGSVFGWPDEAPYDRILVSAAAKIEIPQELTNQMAARGRMVIPVETSIFLAIKDSKGNISKIKFPGFVFVPLVYSTSLV